MAAPRLTQRIRAAEFPPATARTFGAGLREITAGLEDSAERDALIARLTGNLEDGPAAPFEALWPHAELYLTACVYVAVSDGQYRVEEARLISEHAHRLGFSARQLAELEARIFEELRARGAARLAREGDGYTEEATMEATQVEPAAPVELAGGGEPAEEGETERTMPGSLAAASGQGQG